MANPLEPMAEAIRNISEALNGVFEYDKRTKFSEVIKSLTEKIYSVLRTLFLFIWVGYMSFSVIYLLVLLFTHGRVAEMAILVASQVVLAFVYKQIWGE